MDQAFIPAVFLRGGSSKGVFFHAKDLPQDRAKQDAIFLSVLGSPDPYGRQLDGMGGGISSLSKAVIIGPPTHPDADVDYTFAQVAVDRPLVDWSSNCGNLSSAVGPFAVDEGLVRASDGEALVRIHQVNTKRIIHARFLVRGGRAATEGDFAMAGVSGTGARIRLDFLAPGGGATGRLLPTGDAMDVLEHDGRQYRATLIDAANACVFLDARDLGLTGTESPDTIEANPATMALLDALRRQAAVRMRLAATPAAAPPITRAMGVRPYFFTAASEARISAAAPSLTPEALPAVTEPPLRNGVGSFASASMVVARGCSSLATTIGSPLRWGMVTGVISRARRPFSCAPAALA